MRILVCGGRTFANWEKGYWALAQFCSSARMIIHGCAQGADRMADQWARENNIDVMKFPAEWKKYGKNAGPVRNQAMLTEGKPDFVLALPGRRGTRNMVDQARASGVIVVEV